MLHNPHEIIAFFTLLNIIKSFFFIFFLINLCLTMVNNIVAMFYSNKHFFSSFQFSITFMQHFLFILSTRNIEGLFGNNQKKETKSCIFLYLIYIFN
jgi:hypothetical protein